MFTSNRYTAIQWAHKSRVMFNKHCKRLVHHWLNWMKNNTKAKSIAICLNYFRKHHNIVENIFVVHSMQKVHMIVKTRGGIWVPTIWKKNYQNCQLKRKLHEFEMNNEFNLWFVHIFLLKMMWKCVFFGKWFLLNRTYALDATGSTKEMAEL